MFSKEMQKALEADGEKLRQLTGEDHGPWRTCEVCHGAGQLEEPVPQHDDPYYCRVVNCLECNGTGYVEGFEPEETYLEAMEREHGPDLIRDR